MFMQKVIKEATDKNVLESIKENTYSRNQDVISFIHALNTIEENMFISLDGRWGEGKTFYVRQIEMALKYLVARQYDNLKEKDYEQLEKYFQGTGYDSIELRYSYLPVYYNAWLYDNHNDPMLSLIFSIVKQRKKFIDTDIDDKKITDKILGILSSISITYSGLGVSGDLVKLKESVFGKNIFDGILLAEEIREKIKDIFNDIIIEECEKLVIIIDELDRCKPSYAIELLERIKHYFDDERIVFIVSVNKSQLIHTISQYYGSGFDSTGYLNKFFDYNVFMPTIKEDIYNITKYDRDQYLVTEIAKELAQYYRLTLRDALLYDSRIERISVDSANDYDPQGIIMSLFLPIILILDMVDQNKLQSFLSADIEIFERYYNEIESIARLIERYNDKTTTSGEINKDSGFQKIKQLFLIAFGSRRDGIAYKGTYLGVYPERIYEECIKICNALTT